MHVVEPLAGDLRGGPGPGPGLRVLLVAPEGARSPLVEALRGHGFAVLVAPDGAVVQQLTRGAVDVVVLHGRAERVRLEVGRIGAAGAVPIVAVLADARAPLATLLEVGADDCVPRGVTSGELAARVRAVVRRGRPPGAGEVLRAGAFVLDPARHVFTVEDRPVHLSPKEFGLLELLLRRDGRVVTREEALELVWGRPSDDSSAGDPTTVDVHVKRLRAKVEDDPANPRYLLTVRGLGYRFEP